MRGMECSESGPCLESHRQRAGSWKMEADSSFHPDVGNLA